MDYVFSYGTLQRASVQLATFGRLLKGSKDTLFGWSITTTIITDKKVIEASGTHIHPILEPTHNQNDCVEGMALEIDPSELPLVDAYEVSDYQRIQVTLKSGIKAWVYVSVDHNVTP